MGPGGIITAWDSNVLTCIKVVQNSFSLTCWFKSLSDDLQFAVTNVYGPCDHGLKQDFLQSLSDLLPQISIPWRIIGDFNLTLRQSDKSTNNFNFAEANLFSSTINSLQLQDLPLLDRRFTWSNQQDLPVWFSWTVLLLTWLGLKNSLIVHYLLLLEQLRITFLCV